MTIILGIVNGYSGERLKIDSNTNYNIGLCGLPLPSFDYDNICNDIIISTGQSLDLILETFPQFTTERNIYLCTESSSDFDYTLSICDNKILNGYNGQSFAVELFHTSIINYNIPLCYKPNVITKIDYNESCLDYDILPNVINNSTIFKCDLDVPIVLNYDLIICKEYINPTPFTIVPHNFLYNDLPCPKITINNYNGQQLTVTLLSDLYLDNINGYSGNNTTVELSITRLLDINNYNGGYGYTDLTVNLADHLDITFFGGENLLNAQLSTTSNLELNTNLNGSTLATLELLTFEVKLLDIPFTTGSYFNNFNLIPSVSFDVTFLNGNNTIIDVTINPAETLEIINYNGNYSSLDNINTTVNLPLFGYTGEQLTTILSTAKSLPLNSNYNGQLVYSDLTLPELARLEDINYSGQLSTTFLNGQSNLFTRGYSGNNTTISLDIQPSSSMFLDNFLNGDTLQPFILDEDLFYFNNYNGVLSYAELSTETTLNVTFLNCQSSNIDNISTSATLEIVNYNGQLSTIDEIFIHLGEELEIINYTAQHLTVIDDIKIHHVLLPLPIIGSQTLYDGSGGLGGLNFHTLENVETGTIFDVRPSDIKFYSDSGNKRYHKIDIDLATSARFELTAYSGIMGKNLFLNHNEYTLFGNPPLDIVYNDGEIIGDDAPWQHEFQSKSGQTFELALESEYYIRFCNGYLRPSGNLVRFEFSSPIIEDCFGWFAYNGQYSVLDGLSTQSALQPKINYNGQKVNIDLTIHPQLLLDLKFYNGQASYIPNHEYNVNLYSGQELKVDLYEEPFIGLNGQSMVLTELSTATPNVKFTTNYLICLENLYYPLTEDGDIDYTYQQTGIAVENEEYYTKIDGTCTNDYVYRTTLHLFGYSNIMMDVTLD